MKMLTNQRNLFTQKLRGKTKGTETLLNSKRSFSKHHILEEWL